MVCGDKVYKWFSETCKANASKRTYNHIPARRRAESEPSHVTQDAEEMQEAARDFYQDLYQVSHPPEEAREHLLALHREYLRTGLDEQIDQTIMDT
ncbi:hypothetical protein GGF43_004666, partial [Coemansia sp. RSA 2618]